MNKYYKIIINCIKLITKNKLPKRKIKLNNKKNQIEH